MKDRISVRIKRQKDIFAKPYWEEFIMDYRENMNVISLLMEIEKNPVNAKGEKTEPVVWDCNCLEEVCGACSMVINGKPCQACSALVDKLKKPIVLKPLSKFPVKKDLVVDRNIMFETLKRIKAWISIDGTYDVGLGPKLSKKDAYTGYGLSRCMTCGCCMESCPNVNSRTDFIGPFAIAQARLFNLHPTGRMNKETRLKAIMGPGGIKECGNAQNCERLCPKDIKLLESLAYMNRETLKYFIKSILE